MVVRRAVLKAPPVPTEHEEQRDLVRWFRREYAPVRIFAIPNGGYRSMTTAGKLKAEGASAGVPDLFVPAWGLWIEMKRQRGGRVSPEQADWIEYLQGVGHTCIVCLGSENAQEQIRALKPGDKKMKFRLTKGHWPHR
jgi:hypothetical protein